MIDSVSFVLPFSQCISNNIFMFRFCRTAIIEGANVAAPSLNKTTWPTPTQL